MGLSSGSHEGSLISVGLCQQMEKWPWNCGSTHLCLVILNKLWSLKWWGPSAAISSPAEASVLSHPSAKTISEYYLQLWRTDSRPLIRTHINSCLSVLLLILMYIFCVCVCYRIVFAHCKKVMQKENGLQKTYIIRSDLYDFGPVLCGKTKERYFRFLFFFLFLI